MHFYRRRVGRVTLGVARPSPSAYRVTMASCLATNLAALMRRFGAVPTLADSARLPVPNRHEPTELNAASEWLTRVGAAGLPAAICGLGAGAVSLLAALDALGVRTRVLVIEPDPAVARWLLETHPLDGWIDRGDLAVLVGPSYSGIPSIARTWTGLRDAVIYADPGLARREPADETRAREALQKLLFQADANESARRALAGRYLLHTLANLPRLTREGDAQQLRGAFEGTPAIIAAAGPSLDRNVHEMAPWLNRALLIACDTAAWPLVTAGAAPHIVVAIDASEANARHLASLPQTSAALVAEASVHPSALTAFTGRTFFCKVSNHDPWPWLAGLGLDRGHLDAWGSVATTAFALALEMGCNPIVFAGADFAFTDGRPYCRGTSFETIWASWVAGGQSYDDIWRYQLGRWPLENAPDVNGAATRTAPHLLAFRDWVAQRAAAMPGRLVINATGAGVLAGAAIRQSTVAEALGGAPTVESAALTAHLLRQHRAPAVDFAAVMTQAATVAAELDDALLDGWHQFTARAVSRGAIRTALLSAELQAFLAGAGARDRIARKAS